MDTPLQISPLAEGAGPAWLSLMNSGLRDCPGFEPLVDLDYQRMWGGGRARTGLTLAAEREGELVGAVSLILGTRRGRLRDLVVRPDARRCGVGTALVEGCTLRQAQGNAWLRDKTGTRLHIVPSTRPWASAPRGATCCCAGISPHHCPRCL